MFEPGAPRRCVSDSEYGVNIYNIVNNVYLQVRPIGQAYLEVDV